MGFFNKNKSVFISLLFIIIIIAILSIYFLSDSFYKNDLTQEEIDLNVNNTYLLDYSNCNGISNYEISDTSIISFDSNGKVFALKPGNATINIYNKQNNMCSIYYINVLEKNEIINTPPTEDNDINSDTDIDTDTDTDVDIDIDIDTDTDVDIDIDIDIDIDDIIVNVGEVKDIKYTISPKEYKDELLFIIDDEEVAIASNKQIKGLSPGKTNLRVKTLNGEFEKEVKVTVIGEKNEDVEIFESSIKFNTTYINLNKGDKYQINYTSNNITEITWKSNNEKVATVQNGTITAISSGVATITASSGDAVALLNVQVNEKTVVIEPNSIKISCDYPEIKIGDTFIINAKVLPDNANNKTITWTTSNKEIITVDQLGTIVAKNVGEATVTAKTSNGKTGTCKLKVTKTEVESPTPENITFSKSKLEMKVGETSSIIATITANNLKIDNAKITVNDTNKAKITNKTIKNNTIEVKVQCISSGTTKISATYNNVNKEITVNCIKNEVPAEKKVSISFNTVGGGSISSITGVANKNYPTLPTPTRSGYKFIGWYTSLDYNKKIDSSSLVSEANHTLYAKWELNNSFTHVSYPDTIRTISLAAAKSHLNLFPKYERTYSSQQGTDGIEVFNSPYYSVKANNKSISSYATVAYVPSLSKYVFHSFSTVLVKTYPLTIEVTSNITVNSATIYPTSLGAKVQINGNKMTFTVTKAGQYTLVINGSQEYAYTLFVEDFVDEDLEIEKYRRQYGINNVKVYEPKFHAVDYISLQSNSVLYLKSGAYLVANHKYDINSADDESKYKETNTGNRYAFIDSYGKNNIKIIGHGLIDLSKLDWHERNGMKISQSSNIEVRGITFINSANWTLYTYIVNNMTINNVKVFGYRSNSDAYAIANSKNVTISNSFARSGDDLYLVRNMGAGTNAPTDNVTVNNCIAWAKERAFGVVSAVYFDMKNVTFKNSAVIFKDQTDTEWSKTRISSLAVIYSKGTGIIDNIVFDNILITKDNGRPIIINVVEENGLNAGSLTGRKITNIQFKNIRYNSTHPILIDSGNNTNYISASFENVKSGSTLITNSNYNNFVNKNNNVNLIIK